MRFDGCFQSEVLIYANDIMGAPNLARTKFYIQLSSPELEWLLSGSLKAGLSICLLNGVLLRQSQWWFLPL